MVKNERAIRIGARKLGISINEYAEKISNDFKWCSYHKQWHKTNEFYKSRSGYCKIANSEIHKKRNHIKVKDIKEAVEHLENLKTHYEHQRKNSIDDTEKQYYIGIIYGLEMSLNKLKGA